MTPFSWHDAYYSPLQNLWSLLVVPIAFLAYRLAAPTPRARAVVPQAAGLVAWSTTLFALETILDPIATGPLAQSEALRDGLAATLIPFCFVYLGDLRVLFVAFAVGAPDAGLGAILRRAAGAALIVPLATGILYGTLRAAIPGLSGQWLWMIYEAGFLALCLFAGRVVLTPERESDRNPESLAFLRALFGYSTAYYALWLAADVVIVVGGLDLGWAIRMVPNQLYYAFWVPFVYFRFFSAPLGSLTPADHAAR